MHLIRLVLLALLLGNNYVGSTADKGLDSTAGRCRYAMAPPVQSVYKPLSESEGKGQRKNGRDGETLAVFYLLVFLSRSLLLGQCPMRL